MKGIQGNDSGCFMHAADLTGSRPDRQLSFARCISGRESAATSAMLGPLRQTVSRVCF